MCHHLLLVHHRVQDILPQALHTVQQVLGILRLLQITARQVHLTLRQVPVTALRHPHTVQLAPPTLQQVQVTVQLHHHTVQQAHLIPQQVHRIPQPVLHIAQQVLLTPLPAPLTRLHPLHILLQAHRIPPHLLVTVQLPPATLRLPRVIHQQAQVTPPLLQAILQQVLHTVHLVHHTARALQATLQLAPVTAQQVQVILRAVQSTAPQVPPTLQQAPLIPPAHHSTPHHLPNTPLPVLLTPQAVQNTPPTLPLILPLLLTTALLHLSTVQVLQGTAPVQSIPLHLQPIPPPARDIPQLALHIPLRVHSTPPLAQHTPQHLPSIPQPARAILLTRQDHSKCQRGNRTAAKTFYIVNAIIWKQEFCVMLEQFFTFKCFCEVLYDC